MEKLQSGHEVVPFSEEEQEEITKDFPPMKYGVIQLQPGGWTYYKSFTKFADRIYNFKFKPSDVVVMTFPKCGTTWTQEIVWTMLNNLNFDHPDAQLPIMLRSPFFELDYFMDIPIKGMYSFSNPFFWHFIKRCKWRNFFKGIMLEITESTPDPRTIKTHLPFSLLPPNLLDTSKVIYVARNPFDACISYFHHNRLMKGHDYIGSWDKFNDYFMKGSVLFCPYWEIMREAWAKRDHPNLLFCFYEEMKADPRKNIERIDKFLGTKLTEEQIKAVLDFTSFSSMKERDAFWGTPGETPFIMTKSVLDNDGGFFRKGESGNWEGKFNEEQKKKMEKWSQEHLLKGDFGPDFLYYKQFFPEC